ncbi:enoyl-(acyl-carrier-protein) reductase [Ruegeria pomeroyi DSS-3]|uniref:Enoyl-[acyl-carrier-protein] reductase [NADH] n=2 Tax=Ruegeria pomeroyi TaxID=89184 RepID=Q5LWR9_RUEPO|nr:enoyl-(acyl-carrier-protein) reductase [Ruegeria pomeroyi DSS-3]NVK99073.1 enoyl-ACP reductase FabI [Ruegeria pomeroyi]NVL03922.1 enoyl-ACP reductase FabI [Ruegeria pomeroyi]HCE71558.1 enoyl-[acyl-carrier-protein] reductase FabI [Ruegeria sp.]
MGLLDGKRGLVVGIANERSIASGCAQAFHREGAELAVTYLNEKARPFVQPVAEALDAEIFMPLDVTADAEMDALFEAIASSWGRLDFILHSVAYCPKEDLHGNVLDCSREGFSAAMDISVHSFMRLARRARPLMQNGGCLLTVSYYGAEKVVDHYNVMGPVKAALESTVKYMAAELGPEGIRVNALSPGPLMTRAASGIAHFDALIDEARARAPQQRLVTIEDVGNMAAGLVSDAARNVTGNISYVDAGYHVMS